MGSDITKETVISLENIMNDVKKVNDIATSILDSSISQEKSIGQVTIALSQIEQVTQKNTSLLEESASASEELASQETEFKSLVARFKLE